MQILELKITTTKIRNSLAGLSSRQERVWTLTFVVVPSYLIFKLVTTTSLPPVMSRIFYDFTTSQGLPPLIFLIVAILHHHQHPLSPLAKGPFCGPLPTYTTSHQTWILTYCTQTQLHSPGFYSLGEIKSY